MWDYVLAIVISLVVGLLIGVFAMCGLTNMLINEIAGSLTAVRKILGRGDINAGLIALQKIEEQVKKWRRPRVDE